MIVEESRLSLAGSVRRSSVLVRVSETHLPLVLGAGAASPTRLRFLRAMTGARGLRVANA